MTGEHDTTGDEVFTDPSPSLEAHLRAMDTGELMRLSEDIEAMRSSAGWVALSELVAMQRSRVEGGVGRRVMSAFKRGHALQNQAPFLRAGGVVAGLEMTEQIMDKVLAMARVVSRELDEGTGAA